MRRVQRPTHLVAADDVASGFLALDQRVVTALAVGLDIIEVEEQNRVAFMRDLVMGDGRSGMVPVALYDDAAAALAGIEIAEECLLADAVCPAPARIAV
jgi:hypothetical protein